MGPDDKTSELLLLVLFKKCLEKLPFLGKKKDVFNLVLDEAVKKKR